MSTTIKWPVVDTVDPDPFDPCRDVPLDVVQRIGLAYTPPMPEDSLRCKYDAGNYQMAVEAFVWRTYEQTLPPRRGRTRHQRPPRRPVLDHEADGLEQPLVDHLHGGLQDQLRSDPAVAVLLPPIYSEPDPDCMQTNLQRAHELSPPFYVY